MKFKLPQSKRVSRELREIAPSVILWCAFIIVLIIGAIIGVRIPDQAITENDITSQEQRLNISAIQSINTYRDNIMNRNAQSSTVPDPFNR